MSYLDVNIAKELTGLVFGLNTFTAPTGFEIGLLNEGGEELGGTTDTASYTRVAGILPANWSYSSKDSKTGVESAIDFSWNPVAAGEKWDVKYVRVFDQAGRILATGTFEDLKTFVPGQRVTILQGKLKFLSNFFKLSADCE